MRKPTIIAASLIILLTLILNVFSVEKPYKDWVIFYIALVCIARTWETFFTSKGQKTIALKEDWTLPLLTLVYVLMLIGSIIEFYFTQKSINFYLIFVALAVQFSAFSLRWWGMKTLGAQWTNSVIPISKIGNKKTKVIKKGPYKYLRHPIYLGVILDVLAIPLVLNSYYTFFLVLLINVPFQLLRVRLEEEKLIETFGKTYLDYKKEVWCFIPVGKLDYPRLKISLVNFLKN